MKNAEDAAGGTPEFTVTMLPIDKIVPSPTNPRKHFATAEQKELEKSMRAHGFSLSALIVRPMLETYFIDAGNAESQSDGQWFVMRRYPSGVEEAVEMCPTKDKAEAVMAAVSGRYELVCGERRWRAAKAVRIAVVPAAVRTLSDQEVLEQQLVENVQRRDLTALEEAHGFQRMLALRDAAGKAVYTVEILSQKIGASSRHIERRVKLCGLSGDGALKDFVKAFEEGAIGAKHAELVSSIPDPKQRAAFAKEILSPKYEDAPLSLRKAVLLRQRDYMVDLRNSGIDLNDKTIVAEILEDGRRVGGLDCESCPMRAGNAPDLFDGPIPSASANLCMNPACFGEKRAAAWSRWQDTETDPAKKRKALSRDECEKLYRYGDQLEWSAGFVDLGEKPDSSTLKPGEKADGKWKALVKGSDLEVCVVRDRNGRSHELVKRDLAVAAAESNGHKIFKAAEKGATSSPRKSDHDYEAERHEEALKEEIELAGNEAVAAAVSDKASNGKAPPIGFWPLVIAQMMDDTWDDVVCDLERRRGWPEGAIVTQTRKLAEHHQVGVVAEVLFWCNTGNEAVTKLFGINAAAIKKPVESRVKAEQKKRAELRAEIDELAAKAKLNAKAMDEIAAAVAKKPTTKWSTVKDQPTLEAIRAAIVKRGEKSEVGGRKSESAPAAKPAAKDPKPAKKKATK